MSVAPADWPDQPGDGIECSASERPAGVQPAPIRLLYFLGDVAASTRRVDNADLFGKRMPRLGIEIDWYHRTDRGCGPVVRDLYHGRPARVCGRSALTGMSGKLMNRMHELLATLHFSFAAIRADHDIVQVRDDFFAGVLGLVAARLSVKKFVFWLSYPFPEASIDDAHEGRARSKWFSLLKGHFNALMLYRIILPFADHAFVQSEQMKKDVLRPWIRAERLTAVPMGIPDEDIPSTSPVGQATADVLYLGTLARVRRLAMIVRAFALVHARRPDARLLIVGDGDVPQDRAELEAEVAALGLQASVIFTGLLPREEALSWLRDAAVCLSPFYPSFVLRSTSPTKLIEYMAFGKAVVANDHPEQAAVVMQSGAGICTQWDEAQFAQAILLLLNDQEKRQAAAAAGRRWVLKHRRYSLIAADLRCHYDRIVEKRVNSAVSIRG